jgi:hypothetical protein
MRAATICVVLVTGGLTRHGKQRVDHPLGLLHGALLLLQPPRCVIDCLLDVVGHLVTLG